jgi:xylan 1,4-beta-xylosidase
VTTIENPILPGFHPDPSICRAGDWYYIATSTFQWFPGVRVHRSRDLVNWELCPSPLTRASQLPMRGIGDSAGIWAPCLSYTEPADGKPGMFWLIYTVVRTRGEYHGDFPNYLVTAESIEGPWSEPISLNSSGFDPSLYHDDDGRHWLTNMVWDHRTGKNSFSGIALQEYDAEKKALVGEREIVFRGTELMVTEAPHLYKHDGRYYLMTAEGGTFWEHAVTVARADSIRGPYEVDPEYPMLTAWQKPELKIQKAGHASLVETPEGELVLAHLCGRPVAGTKRCILGRETSLQRVEWTADGWLRMRGGGNSPAARVELPTDAELKPASRDHRDDFDGQEVDSAFQSLRVPMEESWITLKARGGHCRLFGRDSMGSLFDQSLIARRVQAFQCRAETRVEFQPTSFQQMAGLTAYYDTRDYYYAHVTASDDGRRVLRLSVCDNGAARDDLVGELELPAEGPVDLRVEFDHAVLRFSYRVGSGEWAALGGDLDATILSDDHGGGDRFTGAFVGICCQDITGRRLHADFDWFAYAEG